MTTVDRYYGVSGDLGIKAPVSCCTTANILLTGLQTIDTVVQTEGMRTLVTNQTDTTQNGIYNASSGPWTRAVDFDGVDDCLTGTAVFVAGGATNAPAYWYLSTAGNPTPGQALGFTKFPGTPGAAGAPGAPGAAGPQGPQGAAGTLPIVTDTGAADALVGNYTPDLTLTDKTLAVIVAAHANATATPTFTPDGLTTHVITMYGGAALPVNAIAGAGHVLILEYNLAGTRWELLNPAVTLGTLGAAKLAGGNAFTGAQNGGVTALVSAGNHIATDLSLDNIFKHVFTENTTLDNPTNIVEGQTGRISFTQHAASPKTLALGSYFIAAGGVPQTVSAVISAKDVLYYDVLDATHILYNIVKGAA